MGSSFCDPTREVCPFGAPIDPTLSLVNNLYVRGSIDPIKLPPSGVQGPLPGGGIPDAGYIPGYTPKVTQMSIRSAPLVWTGGGNGWIPPITVSVPPITFGGPSQLQSPQRPPPLTPGRIPPGPQVIYPGQGRAGCGCNGAQCGGPVDQSGCCPKGCHPDKKYGVKCVRNRRMNPLNHRALKRAIRRMDGFEGIARKLGYKKRK